MFACCRTQRGPNDASPMPQDHCVSSSRVRDFSGVGCRGAAARWLPPPKRASKPLSLLPNGAAPCSREHRAAGRALPSTCKLSRQLPGGRLPITEPGRAAGARPPHRACTHCRLPRRPPGGGPGRRPPAGQRGKRHRLGRACTQARRHGRSVADRCPTAAEAWWLQSGVLISQAG